MYRERYAYISAFDELAQKRFWLLGFVGTAWEH
jgi:hypothetical protein